MPDLNITHIMGRATRDPELRVTPKGTAICTFSLAVNRKFKSEGSGEREETFYAECEAWSKAGEVIAKYVSKGDALYVQGRLKTDSWEDKNTKEKRSRTKIVVENFQFLGGKKSDPSEKPQGDQDRSSSSKPATPQENLDDSIPF